MAEKFNLAELLKGVSASDTDREQIEYIPLHLIDEDPNNFYQLTEIPALADNIAMCGLQQPIRVRQQEGGRYMIVSGHRRRAALEMLAADGYEAFRDAPCIVERDEVSASLQQLRLIYANAATRKLTSAEISEQAVQVEKLLYQLKEEGYEFPGRMRDHVAEAVSVSKTKLARLKVIRDDLAACWHFAWKNGDLVESTAYALAQLPVAWQQLIFNTHGSHPKNMWESDVKAYAQRFAEIDKIACAHGHCLGCDNAQQMMEASCKERYSDPCRSRCCRNCVSFLTCKKSCHHLAAEKKEKKDVARESARKSAEAQAERDAPTLDLIRTVYRRVGEARDLSGVTVEQLMKAERKIYAVTDDAKQIALETGSAKISVNSTLPFGYSFYPSNAEALIRVADALGCSIDFLLGRTDCPDMVAETEVPTSGWNTGSPDKIGAYVLVLFRNKYVGPRVEIWNWVGDRWLDCGDEYDEALDGKILGWYPMMELGEVLHG